MCLACVVSPCFILSYVGPVLFRPTLNCVALFHLTGYEYVSSLAIIPMVLFDMSLLLVKFLSLDQQLSLSSPLTLLTFAQFKGPVNQIKYGK